MSVDASFTIRLQNPQKIMKIILALLQSGWTLNDHGKMSYLPIGDNDDFDWQKEDISLDRITEVITRKEASGELIGIVMTWQNENIGGSWLFWNDGHFVIGLNINRKLLNIDPKITDINWYLMRLLPSLNQAGLFVEHFTYDEHI